LEVWTMATIDELERALNIRHVPEALRQAVRSRAKASGMSVQAYAQRALAEAPDFPRPCPGEATECTEVQTTK
jgi:hypothetical protein